MKVIFILFLCFLVNLVSAQDFQYRLKCKYSKNRLHRKDCTGIEKLQY
mgnify:CR=1 FL=1